MSKLAAFDRIAKEYDKEFTYSSTGTLQRKHILNYLEQNILKTGKLDILEINCGTGEDALWLHRLGHSVLATDISGEMINVAQTKLTSCDVTGIAFRQLSFIMLDMESLTGKFDLVFSNFGGLNCVSREDLQKVFDNIVGVLKPGGRFVGVIMPRYCLWEIFYFFYKRHWKKIFRRTEKGPVDANLAKETLKTWYYSPRQIKKSATGYRLIKIKPIGIALPPSFLEKFFKKKKFLLKFLDNIESVLEHMPFLASFSDHFLFDLEKRN